MFDKCGHELLVRLSASGWVGPKNEREVGNFNVANFCIRSAPRSLIFCLFFVCRFTCYLFVDIAVSAAGKEHKEESPSQFFCHVSHLQFDTEHLIEQHFIVVLIDQYILSTTLDDSIAGKSLN